METRLFIACESAVLDQFSNRVSVFNVLEEINTPTFPGAVPQLTVLGMFGRSNDEPDEYDLRLRMKLEGRKDFLLDAPFKVNFQGALSTRAIGNIPGFVFPAPGRLSISISLGRKKYGLWDITAKETPPELEVKSVPGSKNVSATSGPKKKKRTTSGKRVPTTN
jgi:hypothetical protein